MNTEKRTVPCPICGKQYHFDFRNAEYPSYPHMKELSVHSIIPCSFCGQNMVILFNRETTLLTAVNESWILEQKTYASFSRNINRIIRDLELLKQDRNSVKRDLKKLKDIKLSMQKRHERVEKRFRKQQMEWRADLVINKLRSIDGDSENKA